VPALQRRDGLVVFTLAQLQLREQHVALGADARLDLVGDLAQRALGLLEVAALVPDLAEVEPRLVAHRLGGLAGEQRLENLACLDMLAEREIEPAEQQLGLAFRVRQPLELLRRQQPSDRIEVVVLIEIEKDVAVMQVLHIVGRQAIRVGLLVLRPPGRERQREEQTAERHRPQHGS
jgi:hypothetical protein